MEDIRHLSEVLKSQVALYSELAELMDCEKQSIVSWAIDKTVELTKQKEVLLRRERIQEEARNALFAKLAAKFGVEHLTLADIIRNTSDEDLSDTLQQLSDRLVELVGQIHTANLNLRMLYNTNSRLISDFFTAVGLSNGNAYGPKAGQNRPSTTYGIV
ncbi:MAG: flagellar protein FlgN [Deferribacteraceae bacterium]|jgi:flagellar biosynthesis/type III secretory pathway chaperone|nr:flagellar protein FlgN [Deferribacteraceae bacterium]